MFDKDDRVSTPQGPGTVVYRLMSSSDFSKVSAYSVCLDARKQKEIKSPFTSYTGTIIPAAQVQSLK